MNTMGPSSLLLVVGDGPILAADLEKLYEVVKDDLYEVMCINRSWSKWLDTTLCLPDYIYSYHNDLFDSVFHSPKEIVRLSCADLDNNGEFKEDIYKYEDVIYLPIGITQGGSTLQAVRFGLRMCFSHIIVLNSPLTPPKYTRFVERWEDLNSNQVKCISGSIKDIIGEPTKEWLYG